MLNSPFKFLDAYKKEDKELFFGRDEEVKSLYNTVNTTKLLMVYGASGTGKTSMIECGLRNQFSTLDWEALSIRRNQHIYASFFEQINLLLSEKKKISLAKNKEGILMPENPEMNLANAVKILYQSKFKPIYLLFDQFEELLILGKEPEKAQFFEELQQLLETKTPCRVILILREEFIGHLSEYENLVPSLFRHRFRVEKMNKTKVAQVIQHTLQAAAKFEPPFDVQDSNKLTQAILNNLPDDSREIELVHLQVYLDKLWKRDYQHAQSAKRPVCLTANLIAKEDKLQRILGEFLEEQLSLLTQNDKRLLPLELLISMITQEGTKLQRTENEIIQRLSHNEIDFATSEIPPIIQHLVQNRILRVLKAGDITRYELSHDLLAQIVKSMLTQEMELREKAADIYAVYQEREGFFSQEDLDYMRPYQVYKNYPADLKKRIEDSEAYLQKQQAEELEKAKKIAEKEKGLKERATLFAWGTGVLALIAILAGVWAFQLQVKAEEQTKQIRKLLVTERIAATMVNIRGGTFEMGSNEKAEEQPIHKVTVDSFWISKYEVTQEQWMDIMGIDTNTSYFRNCNNCPIENISWKDVQEFLKKLNEITNKKYRLPSEAEWEYVAKRGNNRSFIGGGTGQGDRNQTGGLPDGVLPNPITGGYLPVGEVAWYLRNSESKTHPVGMKWGNGYGIYDMMGNVGEWCADSWHFNYEGAPNNGSAWADLKSDGTQDELHIVRGGYWHSDSMEVRVTTRSVPQIRPYRIGDIGFRIALSISSKNKSR